MVTKIHGPLEGPAPLRSFLLAVHQESSLWAYSVSTRLSGRVRRWQCEQDTHFVPQELTACGSDDVYTKPARGEEVSARRQTWRMLRKFCWRRLPSQQMCKFCGLETAIESTIIYWGSTLLSYSDTWGSFQIIMHSSIPRKKRQYRLGMPIFAYVWEVLITISYVCVCLCFTLFTYVAVLTSYKF